MHIQPWVHLWGRIHDGGVGCPPQSYPAVKNTAPEYAEGAVGVMRQVAKTRLAVKRRVAYPATVFMTARVGGG